MGKRLMQRRADEDIRIKLYQAGKKDGNPLTRSTRLNNGQSAAGIRIVHSVISIYLCAKSGVGGMASE